MRSDTIVGYVYQAEILCPGCIEGALGDNRFSADHTPEQALDLIAAERGIDRHDEHSFDSEEFPKVVFADTAAYEWCADCGEGLVQ